MRRTVLFICTGNRARSQMAEGLLRQLAGETFDTCSAGTRPKSLVAETIEVMREIGIDVRGQQSKSVDTYRGRSFDYVITVCDVARRECPTFRGERTRLHWPVEDPADTMAAGLSRIDAFRKARDDLRRRVEEFVRERLEKN